MSPAAVRRRWVGTVALSLALAASPSYAFRFHLGPVPSNGLELALLIALGIGYVTWWRELSWRSPYLLPGGLLLVAALIGIVVSPERTSAAHTWVDYFGEPAAAFLLAVAMAARRPHARALLLGLGGAGAIVSLVNIAHTLHAIASHHFSDVTPPVAIYLTANALPLYLEPLLAFALGVLVLSEDRRERWPAAGFALLFCVADLLSFSRLGWITLFCLIVFVAAFTRFRWWIWGALVVIGGAAFALSSSVRRRILVEFTSSQDNTVLLRTSLWKSTLNLLRHRPLQGGGLDGFRTTVQRYAVDGYDQGLIYPHNLFLDFWTETGLLGLIAFCWFAVELVLTGIRGLRAGLPPWVRGLSLGLLGLVLTFLVHGLGDVPYFKNDQALAFWVLVAVQWGAFRVVARRVPEPVEPTILAP